jgi:hypothetical protein
VSSELFVARLLGYGVLPLVCGSISSQAILLQPTIRFSWDGALDEMGGEGWVEVVFAEGGAVAEV